MTHRRDHWSKLPTWWIETERDILPEFKWKSGGIGSNETAALMCYILLVHRTSGQDIDVRITYFDFMDTLSLSKAKVAEGLKILRDRGIIDRPDISLFYVNEIAKSRPWGKLPCKSMYTTTGQTIKMFKSFTLRHRNELNALKLLILVCSRADSLSGRAMIASKTINQWSGIPTNDVKSAASLLISNGLMHQERIQDIGTQNVYWGYRLTGVQARRHGANTSPDSWED